MLACPGRNTGVSGLEAGPSPLARLSAERGRGTGRKGPRPPRPGRRAESKSRTRPGPTEKRPPRAARPRAPPWRNRRGQPGRRRFAGCRGPRRPRAPPGANAESAAPGGMISGSARGRLVSGTDRSITVSRWYLASCLCRQGDGLAQREGSNELAHARCLAGGSIISCGVGDAGIAPRITPRSPDYPNSSSADLSGHSARA